MLLGNKLYNLRKQNNLSQEQLAEKLGVSRQTISNWETDNTVPDIYQMKSISNLFKISLDELLENNEISEQFIEKNFNQICNTFKEKIKKKVSEIEFETWFENIELINLEEYKITLLVPYYIHKRTLSDKYTKLILEEINNITSNKINNIEFIVK